MTNEFIIVFFVFCPEMAEDPRFEHNMGRVEHEKEIDAAIEKWTRAQTQLMIYLQVSFHKMICFFLLLRYSQNNQKKSFPPWMKPQFLQVPIYSVEDMMNDEL